MVCTCVEWDQIVTTGFIVQGSSVYSAIALFSTARAWMARRIIALSKTLASQALVTLVGALARR
jgi:hypothetical protein